MALKGDLASVDLAQVFQMLSLNQKVGLLSIQSPKAWRSLYFDHRGVTLCFNEHTMLDRVLGQLERTGQIGREAIAEARDHAARLGQPVAESLIASGALTEREVDRGVRTELEESTYDIFFWKDARFEFFEGATVLDGREHEKFDERCFFSPDMLIMEAARRIDEWSYIHQRVENAQQVFRQRGGNVIDLEGNTLSIYELIDGKRNVARLNEITGLPKFHVYKALCTLFDKSLIDEVPPQGLLAAARDCFHEGRLQDAINLLERTISVGVGLPEAHVPVAEAYEAIGEYEFASFHNKCVAEHRIEEGRPKDAVTLLREVRFRIPTDLSAWERLVEISAGHPELCPDDFSPLDSGKRLVDLYLEIGEIQRVRGTLETLLRSYPEDLDLKKSLIKVHTKAGDSKRVIELYESIAADLVKQRDPISAIKFLQKILVVDRSRKDISEKIKRLYQLDERRRMRRRAIVSLSVLFVLLICASIGFVVYDQQAQREYTQIDVGTMKANKDYAGAIKVLSAFLSRYPFTIVSQQAEAERASLEASFRAYKAEQRRLRTLEENRTRRIRSQYKLAWKHHNEEFAKGNLAEALKALDSCRDLVEKAGQKEDHRWSTRVKLAKAYKELKRYLGQAAVLDRQARKARDAGDWRAERNSVLELVNDYELTEAARRARVPVMIVSYPKGATVSVGTDEPLDVKTPALVYCPNKLEVSITLTLEGFATKTVTLMPRERDGVAFLMAARPDMVVKFKTGAHSVAGVKNKRLAVGLQGGLVGIAWLDGSNKFLAKLDGLNELTGIPACSPDLVIFQTTEGDVRAHRFEDGKQAWITKTRFPLLFNPVVDSGRVILVDTEGRLFSLLASTGKEIWVRPAGGRVGAPPATKGRKILLGLQTGGLLVLDAANGDVLRWYKTKHGVTTRVLAAQRLLIYGTTDGHVTAIREDRGKVEWAWNAGRAVRSDEMCLSPDGRQIYVISEDDTVVVLNAKTGKETGRQVLPDQLRFGPVVANDMVIVVVRERIHAERNQFRDCLFALDPITLRRQWEFRDLGDGSFKGPPTSDGRFLYVVVSSGEIYRFK